MIMATQLQMGRNNSIPFPFIPIFHLLNNLAIFFIIRFILMPNPQSGDENMAKSKQTLPSFLPLEKLLDIIGVMIVVIKTDQTVQLVNKKACSVLGYEEKEIIGQNWFDNFLPERNRSEIKHAFEKIISGQMQGVEYVENPILTKSGEEKVIAWHNTFLTDESGKIVASLSSGEDITERKQAERALREAEEQYRRLFEISTNAILIRDQQGIIRLANPTALKMLKASKPEDVIGRPYLDFVHPEDRPGSLARIQLQTKAALGEPGTTPSQIAVPPREHRLVTLEGDKIYVESTGVAFSHKGEIWIQGIFQDITERKKAENALRKSEESARRLAEENAVMAEIGRIVSSSLDIQQIYHLFVSELRRLVNFDRVAINIINPDQYNFIIPYVWGPKVSQRNEGDVISLAGTASEEIFKTGQSILVNEQNRKEVVQKFPGLLPIFNAGLISVMMTPLIYQNKVIGVLNVQTAKPNAYTENELKLVERVASQIAGAIANSLLFKEHEKAEEALRESEEKYRNLFSYSLDAVYLSTKEGKFIDFNQATVDLLGYSREELFNLNIRQLYANPDDRPRFQKEIEQKGALKEYEAKFRRKDGTEIDCLLTATLRYDKDRNIVGYQGIIRDITARKRMEKEREILIAELQDALKKIKTLSGLVPICASCKKIRDDKGYWNQLEIYIQEHTQAEFSHGLCPDCMKKLYPDIFSNLQEEKKNNEG